MFPAPIFSWELQEKYVIYKIIPATLWQTHFEASAPRSGTHVRELTKTVGRTQGCSTSSQKSVEHVAQAYDGSKRIPCSRYIAGLLCGNHSKQRLVGVPLG